MSRPARDLSDAELEAQGTHAHATRNWVFLHGTSEQFAHHTERMLELEQEYLRRFPKRTWQGAGGPPHELDEAARLRLALRGIQSQVDALLADATPETGTSDRGAVRALLATVAAAGGRMHRLELHQVARAAGVSPGALAALYRGPDPALRAERDERVLVRRRSGPALPVTWEREPVPSWDQEKQALFATVPLGVFDLRADPGAALPGDWWRVLDGSGAVVGYGWMDLGWGGDAEVALAVDAGVLDRGIGTFVLEHLEQEAAARGVNYVYNVVRTTHPDRERLHDWLAVRGYLGGDRDEALRKRVGEPRSSTGQAGATRPAPGTSAGSDRGPGAEEAGGYVDVDDHRF